MWKTVEQVFKQLARDSEVRAVVISGSAEAEAHHFSAGIDLGSLFGAMAAEKGKTDFARRAMQMRAMILELQEAFTAIEACPQPVIAAIDGFCIGGGIDLITATDIRLASQSAVFSIKEAAVGLAADVGTLQRLPKVVGHGSRVRELAFTGDNFSAADALEIGLVSRVAADTPALMADAFGVASRIAANSPIAVAGTKATLNYARDHSVADGLQQIAQWNMAMIQGQDIPNVAQAMAKKEQPTFDDLYAPILGGKQ